MRRRISVSERVVSSKPGVSTKVTLMAPMVHLNSWISDVPWMWSFEGTKMAMWMLTGLQAMANFDIFACELANEGRLAGSSKTEHGAV
jgi:hypothetical protein